MARPSLKDPLDKFRWSIEISEFSGKAGFTNVSTPAYEIVTTEYAEGGAHLHPRQIIDSISYKPITLSRGVTGNLDFHRWASKPFAALNAKGEFGESENYVTSDYRTTVTIKHLARDGTVVKVYTLYNAVPVEYEVASDFDSGADDAVSLERLVIRYEGFDVESQEQERNPFSPADIVKRLTRNL